MSFCAFRGQCFWFFRSQGVFSCLFVPFVDSVFGSFVVRGFFRVFSCLSWTVFLVLSYSGGFFVSFRAFRGQCFWFFRIQGVFSCLFVPFVDSVFGSFVFRGFFRVFSCLSWTVFLLFSWFNNINAFWVTTFSGLCYGKMLIARSHPGRPQKLFLCRFLPFSGSSGE